MIGADIHESRVAGQKKEMMTELLLYFLLLLRRFYKIGASLSLTNNDEGEITHAK